MKAFSTSFSYRLWDYLIATLKCFHYSYALFKIFSVDLTNHKNITGKLFLQSYYRHFLREKIDFDSISCSAISRENDKLSPWPFLFTNTAWSSRFYRNIQNGVVSQWTRITRPFNEVLSGLSFVGFRLPFVFVHIKKLRHEWKRVAKVTTYETQFYFDLLDVVLLPFTSWRWRNFVLGRFSLALRYEVCYLLLFY